MICIHCGKAIPDGAERCSFCGGESEYALRFAYQPCPVPETPPAPADRADEAPVAPAEPAPFEEEALLPETPAIPYREEESFDDPGKALEAFWAELKRARDYISQISRERRGKR